MPNAIESRPIRSAAQNETVMQTCTKCGAVNGVEARTCCFCDAPFPHSRGDALAYSRIPTETEGNLAVAPDWRAEVSQRLDEYRARRGRPREAQAQSGLPFTPPLQPDQEQNAPAGSSALSTPIRSRRYRPVRLDRLEIDLAQPAFDFAGAEGSRDSQQDVPGRGFATLSVAPLSDRRIAASLDAIILIGAYGVFLVLFSALGGHFALGKIDAMVVGATLGLLYAQYVTLFTYFGAATPGMMLRRLQISSLDGGELTPKQLLWRSLGYQISAGTMMLGFVWALWDEEHLTWHDRISHTFIAKSESETPPAEALCGPIGGRG